MSNCRSTRKPERKPSSNDSCGLLETTQLTRVYLDLHVIEKPADLHNGDAGFFSYLASFSARYPTVGLFPLNEFSDFRVIHSQSSIHCCQRSPHVKA